MPYNKHARPQTAGDRISNPLSGGQCLISSHLSHHPYEVILAQFSIYVRPNNIIHLFILFIH